MAGTKSLIKDSAIYGGSTILVRSVSWLMTALLTYNLLPSEFGMMNYLYAYTALFLVILTFGMETGFFRFANQNDKYKVDTVYSTTLISVGGLVALFLAVFLIFLPVIRPIIWDEDAPINYIRLILIIVSLDAFSAIPFAYLRYQKRPVKFGALKILYIALYAFFCIFFLVVCPWINRQAPSAIDWFWREDFRLGYVFVSNLLATSIQTVFLFSELTGFRYRFDATLAKKMFRYCFPLMLMGLAGMCNQVVDKIVFPAVYPDHDAWSNELGIYNACFKIAMIMMMFTQAFRYAYEPFVFEKSKEKNSKQSYADVMKYFIILGLLVFLGVLLYLDIIKYFIGPKYFGALGIIPVVLIGELCFAIYFNLSIWYKLSDKTYWGAVFSFIGATFIIVFNIIFIPKYSYHACAWASLAGNGIIMLLSYFIGQKNYPIRYDLKTIGIYTGLALGLYAVSCFVPIYNTWLHLGFNTALIGIYVLIMLKRDFSFNFNRLR
ncbi:MAG: lipopolysaccharide biosynthesis protein [Dysgonamonadaceae bacterium]|jgi:O-antigen/teichoic acid export membrane protein|nr:lipopolysaccharide biosynthesis protein [Dysgonamonadaceae bacterium]